jgi:hypothetical protein
MPGTRKILPGRVHYLCSPWLDIPVLDYTCVMILEKMALKEVSHVNFAALFHSRTF